MNKLTKGLNLVDMKPEELEELLHTIKKARITAAEKFAEYLKKSNGNLQQFFSFLMKNGLMRKKDIDEISEKEIYSLTELSEEELEKIIDTLLVDIERDDNLFKSFQIVASKNFYK